MKNRLIYTIPLVIFSLLIAIFARGLSTHQQNAPSPLIEKHLPGFSLPTLEAGKTLTNETFHGHYSLLNIFASWCVSCRFEHRVLKKIGQTIPIYGISWKDKAEDTQHFLATYGNPYQTIGMDMKGNTVIDLGVTGAPETFLIDPEGVVLAHYPGPLTEEVFKERFQPLIR